jgi:hypothetical protein
MRSNGNTLPIIAANIGITEKTLRKHFRVELETGHAQVVAAMGSAVVRAGLNGNMIAARYWLSTHGGPAWRITEGRTIGGMEGGLPIPLELRVVVYLPDDGRGDCQRDLSSPKPSSDKNQDR